MDEKGDDTMLKWVLRIIYVIVISVLSLQIYHFAYFSKLQAYYEEHIADRMDDDEAYLTGMNTLMGLNYFRQSPLLYVYEQDSGDYQLRVSIRAVSASTETEHFDGFVVFVNHVRIYEDGVLVDNPVLRITVELSEATLTVGDEQTNTGSVFFDPGQPFAFYNVPLLFLFDSDNYLKVPDSDVIAVLNTLEISYSNGEREDNALVFNPVPLFIASRFEINEAVLGNNKDADFDLDVDLYRLHGLFANDLPDDSEISLYDLVTDRGDLSPYNHLVWRTMLIYTVIVLALTYLLFFHKNVMETVRAKRYQKEPPKPKSSQTLFHDYEEKDGK